MKKNIIFGVSLILILSLGNCKSIASPNPKLIMAPGPVIITQNSDGTNSTVLNDKCDEDCPQEVMKYKHFITDVKQTRATVYNALNLTDEQIEKKEELLKENTPVYEEKFDNLLKETFTLKALKEAKADERDISNQKKVIKKLKKDIDNTLEKENKEFEKILNHQQRSKYSMIKKLERRDFRREESKKDYYKSNPQMRPFGDPGRKSCPIGAQN